MDLPDDLASSYKKGHSSGDECLSQEGMPSVGWSWSRPGGRMLALRCLPGPASDSACHNDQGDPEPPELGRIRDTGLPTGSGGGRGEWLEERASRGTQRKPPPWRCCGGGAGPAPTCPPARPPPWHSSRGAQRQPRALPPPCPFAASKITLCSLPKFSLLGVFFPPETCSPASEGREERPEWS